MLRNRKRIPLAIALIALLGIAAGSFALASDSFASSMHLQSGVRVRVVDSLIR